METLTLARYILELSLMDYSFVTEKDSMIAAASLFIAQKMRKEGSWVSRYDVEVELNIKLFINYSVT